MKKLLSFALLSVLLASCASPTATSPDKEDAHKAHWSYEGESGPDHWGDLESEYAVCQDGKEQSPIDIVTSNATEEKLPEIKTDYKDVPLKIINNGHTIQVNYAAGSKLTLGEQEYELLQFHFHTQSEHTVDGKKFPMEAHLVHKNADGKLAVIGIFLKEGNEHGFIKGLWESLPTEEGPEQTVENAKININNLLPSNKAYYNYSGSLTTPGCNEIVNWIVLKEPVEVSKEQVEKFAGLFHDNARPVQALNERTVKFSLANAFDTAYKKFEAMFGF